MAMQRQQLDVPLTAGLGQKEDIRDLQVSGAIQMTNCVMLKNGAVTKRAGTISLGGNITGGGTIASVINGGSYKRAPWLSDGERFYSYSNFAGTWLNQDIVSDAVALDRVGIASFTQPIADMDQASANGFLFVVFTCDPMALGFEGLFYTVIDLSSKAPVVQVNFVDTSLVASAIAPKLIVCGTTVILTYVNGSSVVARTLSAVTPTVAWSGETTLASDGFFTTSIGVYDAAPTTGDATRFALAYEVNPGTHSSHCVAIKTFNVSGLSLNHAEFDDTVPTGHLTSIAVVSTNAEWHWATYWATTGGAANVVRAWAWKDSTPATHVAPFGFYTAGADLPGRIAAARTDSTDITAYWSPGVTVGSPNGELLAVSYVRNTMLSTAGGNTRVELNVGIVLTAKPIVTNGTAYIGVQTPSTLQGTAFLCRDDGWAQAPALSGPRGILRAVATLDPRLMKNTNVISMQGNFWQTVPHIVPDTSIAFGSTVWLLPAFESTSPTHQAIYDFPIDLGSTQRYFSAELYELEAISAGVPSVYDGQGICEQSFLYYPEIAIVGFTGTGGHLQTSGLYQYIAVYETYDNRGQLTQSGTSPPFAVTATGSGNTGSASIAVPALNFTQRQNEAFGNSPTKAAAYVVLYRTQANGTIFYRVSTEPPPVAQQVNVGSVITITDTLSDAAIAVNAVLYTTGGNLDNLNPPSARICVQHRNRWWYAGCPDATALWPSKELTTGIVPGWNENQNFTCTGAIRALASLDDKLVVFVQRGPNYGIEFITGEGPTDSGQQSDWTPPQVVPSDSGAIDQRGICVGPFGCLYRSPVGGPNGTGGIFLLSRDLQVTYISRGVEDTLANNYQVTSMLVHPSNGRVYIHCINPNSPSSGVRLVWDYVQGGIWSTDVVGAGGAWGAAWVANVGALTTVLQGQGGTIYAEDPSGSTFADAGTFVSMTYTSAWLKPSKSGFARFWRVLVSGDQKDLANIAVTLTFDYAPSSHYAETRSWTATQISAFDRFPQVDIDVTPNNQKAKAIQVSFADSVPLIFNSGQGISLGAIGLDIGVKEGPYQNLPQAQRA